MKSDRHIYINDFFQSIILTLIMYIAGVKGNAILGVFAFFLGMSLLLCNVIIWDSEGLTVFKIFRRKKIDFTQIKQVNVSQTYGGLLGRPIIIVIYFGNKKTGLKFGKESKAVEFMKVIIKKKIPSEIENFSIKEKVLES